MIDYSLPVDAKVTIEVYNLLGQKVATLLNGTERAGMHTVSWNAGKCSSGMYFARFESGGKQLMKKMLLVK